MVAEPEAETRSTRSPEAMACVFCGEAIEKEKRKKKKGEKKASVAVADDEEEKRC